MSNSPSEKRQSWFSRLSQVLTREPKDREELVQLLHDAKEHQLLDDEALDMIEGVLEVSEMKVKDVMIPPPKMTIIDGSLTITGALPTITQSNHSRFPVVGETRDEVCGILLAKDLLRIDFEKYQSVLIRDCVRPATFIPEGKRLDTLLKEFRLNHNHMAIVVDEYGGVAGLVTIEDVLEEIVGEIEDEYDTAVEPNIKPHGSNHYTINALTPIEEFNEFFGVEYPHEHFETVGGFVLQKLCHLPKVGESIQVDQFQFTVVKAGARGIQLLQITKTDRAADQNESH